MSRYIPGERVLYLRLLPHALKFQRMEARFVRYQRQGRHQREMCVIRVDDSHRDRVVAGTSLRPITWKGFPE